jgi:hypothetical protein
MQQELFFRQKELAQTYQLGLLESEYVINPKKVLANFGLLIAVAILAPLIVFSLSPRATNSISLIILSLIFFIAVGGVVMLSLYRYYRYLHIYVYTNGLLYLNGNKSRVVYWQQMKRAYSNRGYLNIQIKNEMPISIPTYVSRFGELRDRVKQEIANGRSPG